MHKKQPFLKSKKIAQTAFSGTAQNTDLRLRKMMLLSHEADVFKADIFCHLKGKSRRAAAFRSLQNGRFMDRPAPRREKA